MLNKLAIQQNSIQKEFANVVRFRHPAIRRNSFLLTEVKKELRAMNRQEQIVHATGETIDLNATSE